MVSLLAPRWYPVMYTLNRCHRDRFGTNLGPARQVPRFQVTDTPEVLNAATTPKPEPPTLFYTRTKLALPVCGSGTDLKKTDQKRTWATHNTYTTLNLINLVGGSTLYRLVNMTATLWYDCVEHYIAAFLIFPICRPSFERLYFLVHSASSPSRSFSSPPFSR